MSRLLDLLLGAARRSECEANDAAREARPFCPINHQETAMRHGVSSASRALAELERNQPLEPSDEFEIVDKSPGHLPRIAYVRGCSSLEAHMHGLAVFGTSAVFMVELAQQATRGAS
jgi:hypothetical protein